MKFPRPIFLGALLVAAAVAAPQFVLAQDPQEAPAPSATAPAGAPAAPYSNAQLVELYGWFLAKEQGLGEFTLTPDETDGLIKGFSEAVHHQGPPADPQRAGPLMEALMQQIHTSYLSGLRAHNQQANAEFFAQLKQNPNVKETPSGLRYEILKPGDGTFPKATDTVRVNYEGRLIDGTVFDSSERHGGQPAEFALDQVIPGWTEGIQKIDRGGKIRLYIPPDLAYGDDGRQGIPPASALVFDVELLDIKPAAAAGGASK